MSEKGNCDNGSRDQSGTVAGFEDERRTKKLRHMGSLSNVERQGFSPTDFRRNEALMIP